MPVKYLLDNDTIVIDNDHSLDLYVSKENIHLYPQSQKILRILIEAGLHERKVTREQMYECLWGAYLGNEKSCNEVIRGCIKQLRSFLGKETILNQYGVGYFLNEKPQILENTISDSYNNTLLEDSCLDDIYVDIIYFDETPPDFDCAINETTGKVEGLPFLKYLEIIEKLAAKIETTKTNLENTFEFQKSVKNLVETKLKFYESREPNNFNMIFCLSVLLDDVDHHNFMLSEMREEIIKCDYKIKHFLESISINPLKSLLVQGTNEYVSFDVDEYNWIWHKTALVTCTVKETKQKLQKIHADIHKAEV